MTLCILRYVCVCVCECVYVCVCVCVCLFVYDNNIYVCIVCSFVGAVMVSLIRGLSRDLSIKAGLRAAYMSLHSLHAVSEELNPNFLTEESISEWAPWEASQLL